jgi:hypothetical protein
MAVPASYWLAKWQGNSTFWSALLNGHPGNFERDEIVDADNRSPNMWFQSTDRHPTPRQTVPPRRWAAPEMTQQRSDAAVAIGGRIVVDNSRPTSPYTQTRGEPGLRVHLVGRYVVAERDPSLHTETALGHPLEEGIGQQSLGQGPHPLVNRPR